ERDAPVLAFDAGLRPDAMLPGQASMREIEGGDLGVRRLLVVVVEVLAAPAGNAERGVEAEHPAGHVEGVDGVVADLAGAVIPEPVPMIMKAIRIERPLRRRAEPEIIIDAGRNWSVCLVADAGAVAGDPRPRERHLAELAGADKLRRTGDV